MIFSKTDIYFLKNAKLIKKIQNNSIFMAVSIKTEL